MTSLLRNMLKMHSGSWLLSGFLRFKLKCDSSGSGQERQEKNIICSQNMQATCGPTLQRIHVRRYFFCELHFVPFGQADRDLAKMQFRLEIDTATATQEWAECKFACWHICQLPDATWRYLTLPDHLWTCLYVSRCLNATCLRCT